MTPPACDATEKTYEAFAEYVDSHTIVVQATGDIEGEVDDVAERSPRQFRKVMEAFERSDTSKILIYVNGGLNTLKHVRNQAANQLPCMHRDGYFPIFLI